MTPDLPTDADVHVPSVHGCSCGWRYPAPRPERHWFVDDGSGYCAACNLPEANARHAPRPGGATA